MDVQQITINKLIIIHYRPTPLLRR